MLCPKKERLLKKTRRTRECRGFQTQPLLMGRDLGSVNPAKFKRIVGVICIVSCKYQMGTVRNFANAVQNVLDRVCVCASPSPTDLSCSGVCKPVEQKAIAALTLYAIALAQPPVRSVYLFFPDLLKTCTACFLVDRDRNLR